MGEVISLYKVKLKQFERILMNQIQNQQEHLNDLFGLRLELLHRLVLYSEAVSFYNMVIEELGKLETLDFNEEKLDLTYLLDILPTITREDYEYIFNHHRLPDHYNEFY